MTTCGARATRPGRRSHILRGTLIEGATGDRPGRAAEPWTRATTGRSIEAHRDLQALRRRPGARRRVHGRRAGRGQGPRRRERRRQVHAHQDHDRRLPAGRRRASLPRGARPVRPSARCPGGWHQHDLPGDQPRPAPERGEEPLPRPRADEPPRAHRLPADERRCPQDPGALRRRHRRPAPAPGAERRHPADGGRRSCHERAAPRGDHGRADLVTRAAGGRAALRGHRAACVPRAWASSTSRIDSTRSTASATPSPSFGMGVGSTMGRSPRSTGKRSSR